MRTKKACLGFFLAENIKCIKCEKQMFQLVDTADYMKTLYRTAAYNTVTIGELIGDALVDLTQNHCYTGPIHLIGRLSNES